MTYQEFKENVIDIWEDCQKKQEQIVEVKTITKAEVKLSRQEVSGAVGELKRLLPMKEMLVDDIVAYSYMPN